METGKGVVHPVPSEPRHSVQAPLLPSKSDDKPQTCRVYPGRFYVLMVLAFLAIHQNVAWMTFGTIPNESYEYFGLTDDEVTLIAAYGPIAFIPLAFPFMWFLDRFGLRVSILSGSWLLAIGTGIRCFVPLYSPKWTFLFHIGHIMVGIVGLPVMITPPRLSAVWFPPKQRTFATAVTNTSQVIGIALAFIIIPYLTRHYDIRTMLYVQAEMGLFVALLATIYFPAHPPTPPSYSATTKRTRFLSSMKALVTNRAFIVLGISGGLVNGGTMGFSSVLSIILNPTTTGFTDKVEVKSINEFFHSNAWLGACTAMCGVLGGQIVGLIADRIQKKFKFLLLILLTLATVLAFWFAASVYGYTSSNAVNLFVTLCLQFFFAFAPSPLFYEAAVEVTYPVPEGTSAGVISILMNIAGITFQIIGLFHIFSNSDPGKARVMVWVLGGLTGLSGLSILFFEEKYRRLNIDIRHPADSRQDKTTVQEKQ